MCNEGKLTDRDLITEEAELIALATDILKRFGFLPVYHSSDLSDLAFHVRAIRNVIKGRLTTRALAAERFEGSGHE